VPEPLVVQAASRPATPPQVIAPAAAPHLQCYTAKPTNFSTSDPTFVLVNPQDMTLDQADFNLDDFLAFAASGTAVSEFLI